MDDSTTSPPRRWRIGHGELLLRHRYETASIVNDILIAAWFIAGSIMFFQPSTSTLGTWMFLFGSIELAIRPSIRLIRHFHLRRIQAAGPPESDHDF
ncbi:YrhK family protein [Saccharopolyspora sp. TS4A08]|uniref:YrhK family protein n=1 Tax=Saccharopolyspora ipomoeae TaxID=3042027 RepID=A0ABT6PQS1_9PSEU|nr:YrhK family protein [Saccharopolyspora sp. TS4A08]MDI2030247.1 YrhK family protein [Saccharopolyspora sp. TS4A08]